MEYKLKRPYTEKERNDFIVKYNHELGLELEFRDDGIIAKEHELSEEEQVQKLRNKREKECFGIINRGKLWYNTLTEEQIEELDKWYKDWLAVTETKIEPEKPEWIK